MADNIKCKHCGEKRPALGYAPYPNELGQRIGKAYSIEEVAPSSSSASTNNFSINSSGSSGDEAEATSGTLAVGQIKVNARVLVRFELE